MPGFILAKSALQNTLTKCRLSVLMYCICIHQRFSKGKGVQKELFLPNGESNPGHPRDKRISTSFSINVLLLWYRCLTITTRLSGTAVLLYEIHNSYSNLYRVASTNSFQFISIFSAIQYLLEYRLKYEKRNFYLLSIFLCLNCQERSVNTGKAAEKRAQG